MSERFEFDESYIPVPPAAVDADPAQTIRELMFRVSKLEHDLASQEAQAVGDVARDRRAAGSRDPQAGHGASRHQYQPVGL